MNNNGRKMRLDPGQLIGATSWLAHRWNWTPKTVRVFLLKLEAEGMISRTAPSPEEIYGESGHGRYKGKYASVISICKYSQYQLADRPEGPVPGQAEGELRASKGPVKGHIYKEETKEQIENNPPTPLTQIEAHGDLLAGVTDDAAVKRAARAAETRRRNDERKLLLDSALSLYNRAAEHFGFSRCDVLSEARAARLERRLGEIGGIEPFRLALRAIGRDDFLAGRVPPRHGETPFRLNIDRLMQTDGGLGDVLARLLEMAATPERLVSPNGKQWGWWRGSEDKLRTLKPEYWRDLLDRVKPNGTWPWWILAAPPGHSECLVHPDVLAERGLVEIYKGNIEHV